MIVATICRTRSRYSGNVSCQKADAAGRSSGDGVYRGRAQLSQHVLIIITTRPGVQIPCQWPAVRPKKIGTLKILLVCDKCVLILASMRPNLNLTE